MLCQNCGKNEANVKYTQIINGIKKQMNLCEECARKLGINDISFSMPSIDFSNFLGGMFGDEMDDFIPSLIKPQTLLCDKCGSSYEEFIENGKFGCDSCYETFENKIDNLLKKIHGVNRHTGRIGKFIEQGKQTSKEENSKIKSSENTKKQEIKEEDKNDKNANKLEQLQERLKLEIKEERYEDAAKTRDEIRKLTR